MEKLLLVLLTRTHHTHTLCGWRILAVMMTRSGAARFGNWALRQVVTRQRYDSPE
jgi:hypothetical protein